MLYSKMLKRTNKLIKKWGKPSRFDFHLPNWIFHFESTLIFEIIHELKIFFAFLRLQKTFFRNWTVWIWKQNWKISRFCNYSDPNVQMLKKIFNRNLYASSQNFGRHLNFTDYNFTTTVAHWKFQYFGPKNWNNIFLK